MAVVLEVGEEGEGQEGEGAEDDGDGIEVEGDVAAVDEEGRVEVEGFIEVVDGIEAEAASDRLLFLRGDARPTCAKSDCEALHMSTAIYIRLATCEETGSRDSGVVARRQSSTPRRSE